MAQTSEPAAAEKEQVLPPGRALDSLIAAVEKVAGEAAQAVSKTVGGEEELPGGVEEEKGEPPAAPEPPRVGLSDVSCLHACGFALEEFSNHSPG